MSSRVPLADVSGPSVADSIPGVPPESHGSQQGARKVHERIGIRRNPLTRESYLVCRCDWRGSHFSGEPGYESANAEFDRHVDDAGRA